MAQNIIQVLTTVVTQSELLQPRENVGSLLLRLVMLLGFLWHPARFSCKAMPVSDEPLKQFVPNTL